MTGGGLNTALRMNPRELNRLRGRPLDRWDEELEGLLDSTDERQFGLPVKFGSKN